MCFLTFNWGRAKTVMKSMLCEFQGYFVKGDIFSILCSWVLTLRTQKPCCKEVQETFRVYLYMFCLTGPGVSQTEIQHPLPDI